MTNGFVQHTSSSLKVKIFYHFFYDVFFNKKKGSKKGYMEMTENFYLETLWDCPRSIHLSLLKLYIVIQNNKFKMWALTWNEEFQVPDESYFVSETQDYFEYTLKITWDS